MSDLDGYQKWALGMASPVTTKSRGSMLLAAALGLAGEGGEVADMVKKLLFHREGGSLDELSVEQRGKFIDEASDVLWYLALLGSALDVTLSEVLAYNVDKLTRRHGGRGFNYSAYEGTTHVGAAVDPGAPGGDRTVTNTLARASRYQSVLESMTASERERLLYGNDVPEGSMTAREFEERYGDHWTDKDQAELEAGRYGNKPPRIEGEGWMKLHKPTTQLPEGFMDAGKMDWTMDLTGNVEPDPDPGSFEE